MPDGTSVFITNNGLSDHIGVAQVLPYMQGLAKCGHDVTVISVEDPAKWDEMPPDASDCAGRLRFSPIFRRPGRLHRFAIPLLMRRRLMREMRTRPMRLIHCRSYMPLGPALHAAARTGASLLCDLRGFWLDQRLEGGVWSDKSALDRAKIAHFRRLEARAYAEADHIVTLTEDAKAVIAASPHYGGAAFSVIPCSVDQDAFAVSPEERHAVRAELGIPDKALVVCYLGSTSGVYRMDLVNRVYAAIRALVPDARLLLIGGHEVAQHRRDAKARGVALDAREIITRKVPHRDVPKLLNAADVGLSFQVSTRSSLGVSATKVGEYMACGLPVASNLGVGDIEQIVQDGLFGAVLPDDSEEDVQRVAHVLVDLAQRADRHGVKTQGQRFYSMDQAVARYDAAYRTLLSPRA